MHRLGLIAALLLFGTQTFANYGDVSQQIVEVKSEVTVVAEALTAPAFVADATGTCKLRQDHLVQIPVTFTSPDPVSVACLEE